MGTFLGKVFGGLGLSLDFGVLRSGQEGVPQGLKPGVGARLERAKPEGLAYLV
jgi:hypothetical protein